MLDHFASLYRTLLLDKFPENRILALEEFLRKNEEMENKLALDLLHAYKIKPLVRRSQLLEWLLEYTKLPEWLIKESHDVTGDWSETFSLIIGNPQIRSSGYSLRRFLDEIDQSKNKMENLRTLTLSFWDKLSGPELFFFHRLVLGTYKPLLEQGFLSRFLSKQYRVEQALVSFRLNRQSLGPESFRELIDPVWQKTEAHARPIPFREISAQDPESGSGVQEANWIAEPFVSGIRVQVHLINAEVHFWAYGEEYMPSPIEDPLSFFGFLPEGTVLEGILTGPPVVKSQVKGEKRKGESGWKFLAFDLLQLEYQELKSHSLSSRKQKLDELFKDPVRFGIRVITYKVLQNLEDLPLLESPTGWVLKSLDEPYHPEQMPWIRIKPPGRQVNAVLMYAEAIPARLSVYQCTFGIYNEDQTLVPVVRLIPEGLPDPLVTRLHYWIQNNTLQRFGPVRVVRPQQIFQIGFDDVIENQRLKARLTLKNPKILAWLPDREKSLEIGSLDQLKNPTDPSVFPME